MKKYFKRQIEQRLVHDGTPMVYFVEENLNNFPPFEIKVLAESEIHTLNATHTAQGTVYDGMIPFFLKRCIGECCWHNHGMPQSQPPDVICCHCGEQANTYSYRSKKHEGCGAYAPREYDLDA